MIDLDAIKAAGLNSDAESRRLLDLHRWRAAVALHGDLCAKYLRDNPGSNSAEYEFYGLGAAIHVGLAA
jgi:hypothetical protein